MEWWEGRGRGAVCKQRPQEEGAGGAHGTPAVLGPLTRACPGRRPRGCHAALHSCRGGSRPQPPQWQRQPPPKTTHLALFHAIARVHEQMDGLLHQLVGPHKPGAARERVGCGRQGRAQQTARPKLPRRLLELQRRPPQQHLCPTRSPLLRAARHLQSHSAPSTHRNHRLAGPSSVPASLLCAHQVPGCDAQRRDDASKQQDQQDEGRRLLVLREEPLGQGHRH